MCLHDAILHRSVNQWPLNLAMTARSSCIVEKWCPLAREHVRRVVRRESPAHRLLLEKRTLLAPDKFVFDTSRDKVQNIYATNIRHRTRQFKSI
jgi:hypothetical protein